MSNPVHVLYPTGLLCKQASEGGLVWLVDSRCERQEWRTPSAITDCFSHRQLGENVAVSNRLVEEDKVAVVVAAVVALIGTCGVGGAKLPRVTRPRAASHLIPTNGNECNSQCPAKQKPHHLGQSNQSREKSGG